MAVLTKSPYSTTTTLQQQQQQQQQQQTHFASMPGTTLHLYKTGHGNLHILGSDNQTRLYDIKIHSFSSPDISLYRLGPTTTASASAPAATGPNANANANTSNPILCGTAKIHNLSCTIDLQIIIGASQNNIIPFKAPRMLSSSRVFESSVGELRWKHDMRLLNTKEEVLATFTHAKEKWSFHLTKKDDKSEGKKWGWFEIAPQVVGQCRLVDEIVLSGMALLEFERRATQYGTMGEVANAAGGGAGAAVGG